MNKIHAREFKLMSRHFRHFVYRYGTLILLKTFLGIYITIL